MPPSDQIEGRRRCPLSYESAGLKYRRVVLQMFMVKHFDYRVTCRLSESIRNFIITSTSSTHSDYEYVLLICRVSVDAASSPHLRSDLSNDSQSGIAREEDMLGLESGPP